MFVECNDGRFFSDKGRLGIVRGLFVGLRSVWCLKRVNGRWYFLKGEVMGGGWV